MKHMDLQIRPATPSDAEVIALLGRITFAETFGYLFTNHAADLRAYLDYTFGVAKIRNSLTQADNGYWISFLNGLPVGYAKMKYPLPADEDPYPAMPQLQKIYVLHEFLREGIGKALIEVVLKDLAARALDTVELYVLKENARAIQFYKKLGFVARGDHAYPIGAQTFHFDRMVLDGVSARH